MKKFILSLGLVPTCAFSYGIVEGAPAGSEFHLEQNQQAVTAQQVYQGRIESNNDVPISTNDNRPAQYQTNAQKASQTMALVAKREEARRNLKNADTRIKVEDSGNSNKFGWIAGILIILVSMVSGYYYLDKSTPNAPEKKIKKKAVF